MAPVRSGCPKFQESRFDNVPAGSSHLSGDVAHGLIGAFDARAVGEDDEPGHTCINAESQARDFARFAGSTRADNR